MSFVGTPNCVNVDMLNGNYDTDSFIEEGLDCVMELESTVPLSPGFCLSYNLSIITLPSTSSCYPAQTDWERCLCVLTGQMEQ
jgi:hypothetical protein